jgi:hypothetical protein
MVAKPLAGFLLQMKMIFNINFECADKIAVFSRADAPKGLARSGVLSDPVGAPVGPSVL